MLDHPKKTIDLILTLKAATPFEVELPQSLIGRLRAQGVAINAESRRLVSEVSYDDQGGIFCRIVPIDGEGPLVVSLTHLQAPRALPFAAAVLDYQKHRMKKLKKLYGADWKAPVIERT
jgi:hypothetical protein